MMLVECGAIRERVSQELARAMFDAVKRDVRADETSERMQILPLGLGHAAAMIDGARERRTGDPTGG